MNKTKAQLRAEAVERLRKLNCMDVDCYQLLEAIVDDAGEKVGYRVEIRKLIDLLTDDAHESRGSYEERLHDVPVSDCPYCGCKRVVIHDYSDIYENPHSYRVEHIDEKEAFEAGCFESYYSFDSAEKAVEHANMRDTLTDEQTNGIEGETNGIADGSPLVDEPPESDAIAHARWRWEYRPEDGDGVVMSEYNCNLLMSDLDAIADMVERDYVSREMYDSERNLLLDKLVAADDAFIELKSRHCPHYHADKHYCDVWETRIKALTAERDEWKAKAEGSSNVRASDMLTDDETCPNSDGTCPDADGTASNAHESHGDALESVLDGDTDSDKGEGVKAAQDTREKLEADVSAWIANEMGVLAKYGIEDAVLQQAVFEWLDRQESITERHWMEICGANANANIELKRQIDALEANNAQLHALVAEMQAERDMYRDKLEAELNRTCTLAYDGKWLICSNCGESLQWFGVRTIYKECTQERALGVEGVRFCPFCGARIEDGDGE